MISVLVDEHLLLTVPIYITQYNALTTYKEDILLIIIEEFGYLILQGEQLAV